MDNIYRSLLQALKSQSCNDTLEAYFELIKENVSQKEIVYNIVKETIPILYRTKYFHVPHGIMGIMAALDLSNYLESYKFLPLAQALAYLANENKLAPLNFSDYSPLFVETDNNISTIESYIDEGNVAKTYRFFLALLSNNAVNDDLHRDIFNIAMKDTVNIGHKAIYYHKILELIDFLGEEPSDIYYPSISYLASEPKDFSIYDHALKEYNNYLEMNINIDNNNLELSKEDTLNFTDQIIYSMKSRVLTLITKLIQNGISIQSLTDNLILAASQLILNTDLNDWIKPIHAFNYCHAVNCWIRKYNPENKVLALYLQAALINRLSIELKKVHFLASPVYIRSKNILNNIARSIQVSNVSDAVALTQSCVCSNCDYDDITQLLAFLSVQNGSIMNFTHDMKFTSSCIKEYKINSSPNRWMIYVALAKHLAQSTKDRSYFNLFEHYFLPVTS
ncbi:MAG: hypothetical protein AB1782_15570 [Cyanobacteriota bacterium]